MKRICFVCLGNICRSPMAEFVFKNLVEKQGLKTQYLIESRATSYEEEGNGMHPGTRRELEKNHIPFTNHISTPLKETDYQKFDYFIGMDASNIRSMNYLFSNDPEHKVFRLLDITPLKRDIRDPWYTGNFEITYQDVVLGCQELLKILER